MPARLVPVVSIALIVACGCGTPGIRGGKKYTRFSPDAQELIEPARHAGEHFIVVRMAHGKGLARWPDTKRRLRAGDRIGFTRDERGRLLAVAGDATCSLEPVPVGIAYLAWYHREDRPLHDFAYGLRDRSGPVLGAAAEAATGVGTGLVISAIRNPIGDDDEERGRTDR